MQAENRIVHCASSILMVFVICKTLWMKLQYKALLSQFCQLGFESIHDLPKQRNWAR